MVNETAGAAPAPNAQSETDPVLALQNVYLKDCSYEAPNGPRMEGNWNPQINLDLHTAATALTPELREVVLTVTVSAKQNDVTIFLVEVKQAGVFLMRNLNEDDAKRAVSSVCPSVLFPYARAAVSQLVTQGGFPQFLLPPVNFDALYASNQTQQPTTTN
ncbi:MAG: preprotein translocase subunit SecB [Gammaproteobacteria bacterium]|jgi:preprotein translocase subunit SecB|nr:preprotein translocase subunit SecB [Gammaproteobacteria bacterium]